MEQIEILINVLEPELDKETMEKAKEIFIELINKFTIDKNIKTLNKIIIPNDFEKEIVEFQVANNLAVGYTNSDYGVAVAKTFRYDDGNDVKQAIFFEKNMFARIICNDTFGLIHLYHELSHVYYYECIGDEFNQLLKSYQFDTNIMKKINNFSYSLWEEYFVSRELVSYISGNTDCYMEIVINHYNKMKQDIEEDILKYRYDNDLGQLHKSSNIKVKQLFLYMSYSVGMVAGLEEILKIQFKEEFEKEIESKTNIKGLWEKLYNLYGNIYTSFPNIEEKLDILDDISEEVFSASSYFGIYNKIQEDGNLYIDVPL